MLTHAEELKDRAVNIIQQTWYIMNKQTGKVEDYTAKNPTEMLTKINDANKSRGETTVRLFNGKTGKLVAGWKIE